MALHLPDDSANLSHGVLAQGADRWNAAGLHGGKKRSQDRGRRPHEKADDDCARVDIQTCCRRLGVKAVAHSPQHCSSGNSETEPNSRGQNADGGRFAHHRPVDLRPPRSHTTKKGQLSPALYDQDRDDVVDDERADEQYHTDNHVEHRREGRHPSAAEGRSLQGEGAARDYFVVRPNRRLDARCKHTLSELTRR